MFIDYIYTSSLVIQLTMCYNRIFSRIWYLIPTQSCIFHINPLLHDFCLSLLLFCNNSMSEANISFLSLSLWLYHVACGVLAPRPGAGLVTLQWKLRTLTTRILEKSQKSFDYHSFLIISGSIWAMFIFSWLPPKQFPFMLLEETDSYNKIN